MASGNNIGALIKSSRSDSSPGSSDAVELFFSRVRSTGIVIGTPIRKPKGYF